VSELCLPNVDEAPQESSKSSVDAVQRLKSDSGCLAFLMI